MPLDLESFAYSRGFDEHELKEFGVRVENGEVVIPILGRTGVWYERRHRPNGVPKYLSPKGASHHLYNPLGLGPHSDEVWFAEGEFDTLSLVVSGVPGVGILGTESFRAEWALLFEHAEIVIAFDNDTAGERRAETFMQMWPPGRVHRFNPSPYSDLNEWFVKDREGFEEAVHDY
jgi:hypothetical protein